MNKRKFVMMLSFVLMIVGAGAEVVNAATIGDGYQIAGYNAGWTILIIGIIVGGLGWGVKAFDKFATPMKVVGVAMFFIGAAMLTVSAPASTTDDDLTGTNCCDFSFTGAAITSGANYISDATWNENTNTLTVPIDVNDSSGGNLNGGYETGVNITLEALGKTTDTNCVFTVTSDYTMTYGGETVLDKSGSDYLAQIQTTSGVEYITDTIQVAAGSTAWINCSWQFVNGTSGSWVSELEQIGDSFSFFVTIENACGEKETITVTVIVIDYDA